MPPLPDNAVDEAREQERANSLDRRRISQPSRGELRDAIGNVDDPDARQALELMFEIMTGEDP